MPIEFRCSQCSQLLRVPDESAGKNARCPKCQALMKVPDLQAEPATLTEGTPPQSGPTPRNDPPKPAANPFGDFGGSPFGGPATSTNPYASPAAAAYSYQPQFGYPGARLGLPWETQPRTLGCWFRTAGMVLGSPSRAFVLMRPQG